MRFISVIKIVKELTIRIFTLGVIASVIYGCTTPLDNEVATGEQKYVVYGYIHNGEPPYTVEINRSQLYSGRLNGIISISGAIVTLHEEGGAEEILQEVAPGQYQSCTKEIQGTPGKAYWVSVFLPSRGFSYVSAREVMPEPVVINDLEIEPAVRDIISPGDFQVEQEGLIVKVSFDDDPEQSNQYFIKYKGTYSVTTRPQDAVAGAGGQFTVPAPEPCSGYIYNENQGLIQVEECKCCVCWIVEDLADPILLDDDRFAGNTIQGLEVVFVPNGAGSQRVGNDYWIGAELRNMTAGAWDYWDVLLKQKNGDGTIFQPPPSPLPGNIIAEGEAPQALGYFYAASRDIYGISGEQLIPMGPSENEQDFSCLRYDNSVNVKPDYYPY
ncbi:DUF4249 family protein [Roseivirga sp. BDSF3-8]|uniref:DUF4249 family protein n=1 Tax=Roseivirga sp. BDSF3-8 TaxID=3241598 RepID=UPI003531D819